MSAWMVSKAHIDALVTAAAGLKPGQHDSGLSWYVKDDGQWFHSEDRRELGYSDRDRASEVGMMLWAENWASINYRYPDTVEDHSQVPGPADFRPDHVLAYRYTRARTLEPVAVLKAIACYEYQSCEHPGWRSSEARQFCQSLKEKMVRQLPGYNTAPWGIDEAVNA